MSPHHCKVLDFGCGSGEFLEKALALGMDAYGCDIAEWVYPFLDKKNLIERVFIGDIAAMPQEDFDIIHISGTMTHLYHPREVLSRLLKKLKPNGLLALMSIPNISSLFVRLNIDSFDGNIPLVHLNFFSPASLVYLVSLEQLLLLEKRTHGIPLRLVFPPFLAKFFKAHHPGEDQKETLKDVHWQNQVSQSVLSNWFKRVGLYESIRCGSDFLLNLMSGGAVIDVIAKKSPSL